MPKPKVLAIVGGGASGTILAWHAIRSLKYPTDIIIFERSGNFGGGLAYTLDEPCFLLNVRADRMGAFEDDPAHFLKWISTHRKTWCTLHSQFKTIQYQAEDFVPRMIYGAYLRWILEQAQKEAKKSGHNLLLVKAAVQKIAPEKKRIRIICENGNAHVSDAVVFAVGNSYAREMVPESQNVFSSPYNRRFIHREWKDNDHILILGTGLSMVDAIQILNEKKFKGTITALSRRGLVPLPHQNNPKHLVPFLARDSCSNPASQIVKEIRKTLKSGDWQDKIDSLRGITNPIWHNLKTSQQQKLFRALPWWSIARHRIPDYIFDGLQKLKENGRLKILKTDIDRIDISKSEITVKTKDGKAINANALVHCAGFSYDTKHIQALCPEIFLNRHWSGSVTPIKGMEYRISEQYPVFTLGPLLFGWNFESTAIHEIRTQAPLLIKEIVL